MDQTVCFFTVANTRNSSSKETIRRRNREKRYPLLSFHELPDYMKDNDYILNYYRANWPLKVALRSLFQCHNETLNIWTHLLGFLVFVGLTVGNLADVPQVVDFITMFSGQLPSSAEGNVSSKLSLGPVKPIDLQQKSSLEGDINSRETSTPNWPFYVFLCGSMFCLLSSSMCHLFCCHSRRLNEYLLQLDYVGITIMIITSFFPPIYYIFQCTPHWQFVYLTGITIIGTCTVITLLSPALMSGKFRSFRALLFVSMGLFGLIPAVHALVANWNDPYRNITLAYESAMALSYLIGTLFYVSRVPERWKPGWFDLVGQSHQVFHVFVVMGALAHYGAAQIFLRCRTQIGCNN
ncbi:heptahelical transmembrane protein 1 [Sesamum indicum]|uniref:Heptahelical transmembrane protein 1 n=1 Tax=Sesamum indicum TaxID=4182 RepID=A0A6I9TJ00_SESIN|nr:heptahelical transmembrane protein 1 [Sesamum indicum]